MIEPTIEEALGKQINQEFTAAYNYLGMAAYFDSQSLDGFANWMQIQHDEEVAHAVKRAGRRDRRVAARLLLLAPAIVPKHLLIAVAVPPHLRLRRGQLRVLVHPHALPPVAKLGKLGAPQGSSAAAAGRLPRHGAEPAAAHLAGIVQRQ